MNNFGMLEDGDHIAHDNDAHVMQILLGQIQQHVLLDAVVTEYNSIVNPFTDWYACISEELYPEGGD